MNYTRLLTNEDYGIFFKLAGLFAFISYLLFVGLHYLLHAPILVSASVSMILFFVLTFFFRYAFAVPRRKKLSFSLVKYLISALLLLFIHLSVLTYAVTIFSVPAFLAGSAAAEICIAPQPPFVPGNPEAAREYSDIIRNDFELYIRDIELYFRCLDDERARAFEEAREVSEDYARFLNAVE